MHTEMNRPVVVGVDGTAGSLGALRYAAAQAVERECGLNVVHVSPWYEATTSVLPYVPQDVDEAGETMLAEAEEEATRVGPELNVTTNLRNGSRISGLVAAADHGQLLVLGRETRTRAERFVFGATTAAVVARTAVPAAVVPAEWTESPARGPVVAGLRTAEHSSELFEAAFALAEAHSTGVDVIHAWRMPDPYIDRIEAREHGEEWVAAGTELVERELDPWRTRYPGTPVAVRVVHDGSRRALLIAAEHARVVVLLRKPAPRLLGAHLGSTARFLLQGAPCPVYVVPGTRDQDEPLDVELERSGALLR